MMPTPPPCPRCGAPIHMPARFCSACGVPLFAPGPLPPLDTHGAGFSVIAVLISLLWFRINGVPIFPLGLAGGLALAYWSHDINTKVGRELLFVVTAILCVLATVVGLLLRWKGSAALPSRETLIRNLTY